MHWTPKLRFDPQDIEYWAERYMRSDEYNDHERRIENEIAPRAERRAA